MLFALEMVFDLETWFSPVWRTGTFSPAVWVTGRTASLNTIHLIGADLWFSHFAFQVRLEKFIECQSHINSSWDFLENAAIIENCDLIITCDTSIAHLAGGMGKKVWLLLRDIPFWTWGLEGDTTFWYPSMRFFRQKERHNWQEVMERVSNQLNTEFGK